MSAQIENSLRLPKPWSIIARISWIAVVSLIMVLFAVGLLTGFEQMREVCVGNDCHPSQLNPAQAELNKQLGLSLDFYAWFTTISFTIYGFTCFIFAWLIFWQRYDDRMALFVSLWLVFFGAGTIPVVTGLGSTLFRLANSGIIVLFCLFPDGRFVPRWTRWLVIGWGIYLLVIMVFYSSSAASSVSDGPPDFITIAAFLIGIGAQVYRYRRVSNSLLRQQTKWAVFGFVGWFASLISILLALTYFPALRADDGLAGFAFDKYWFALIGLLPILFIPAGIGISILRYRLWDIDLIIRRTLQYSVLTGLLSLLYFSAITLLQFLVTAITGRSSPITIVLTTLLIVALSNPLRRRVQDFIDRRFYRRKYDAELALAKFADAARSQTDLAHLIAEMAQVAQETLQPESLAVWLNTAQKVPR
jgi:hypothetical protein